VQIDGQQGRFEGQQGRFDGQQGRRLRLFTVVTPAGQCVDVELDHESAATLGDLATLTPALLGTELEDAALHAITQQFGADPRRPLGLIPLDGAILGRGERPNDVCAGTRLIVETGPCCGEVFALHDRWQRVGSDRRCEIVLPDPTVPRVAAWIRLTDAAVELITPDGERNAVPLGECWNLGLNSVRVSSGPVSPGEVRINADGSRSVLRAFRNLPRIDTLELDWPSEPAELEVRRFPWLTTGLPVLGSVGLAIWLGRPEYLAFAALSPLMVVGSTVGDRRQRRRSHRRAVERLNQRRTAVLGRAADHAAEELRVLHGRHPSAAEWVQQCAAHGSRLWERRLDDADAMWVRLGAGEHAAQRQRWRTEAGRADETVVPDSSRLVAAPVVVELRPGAPLGIAGPAERVGGVLRSILVQIIAAHGPDVVDVEILSTTAGVTEWRWLRWAPHARRAAGSVRVTTGHGRRQHDTVGGPAARRVLVIESVSGLLGNTDIAALFAAGHDQRTAVICTEATLSALPAGCANAVRLEPDPQQGEDDAALINATGDRQAFVADRVSLMVADAAARAVCGLRPLQADATTERAGLPERVRLFDAPGCAPHRRSIVARWCEQGAPVTAVPIGVDTTGWMELDLVRDGPHALVAGTSGSGKSQLLLSWVAALAVANSPQQLQFVLVDFKGGGAFGACAALPHVAAVLTNLERSETERAMDSLIAECERRQRLTRDHGGDFDRYRAAVERDHSLPSFPRLVVMVDEFAQLKEEHPDLMDRFTQVARLGRSLGMHLVLGTQRPGGVVDAQVRSNTSLRIALRMLEPGDSVDVIDAPDAATLPADTPGRALIAAAGVMREIQTAVVGVAGGTQRPLVDARVIGWPEATLPRSTVVDNDGPTDLAVLVDVVGAAVRELGLEVPPPPFLPMLPTVVEQSALSRDARRNDVPSVALGLCDEPGRQRRSTWELALDEGHLLVVGAPGSGRTTLLRSLCAGLAEEGAAGAPVHLQIVDFGGDLHDLGAAASAGIVGSLLGRGDPDLLERFVDRLTLELDRRVGVALDNEPWIVVAVDRWEALVELDGGPGGPLVGRLRRLIADATQRRVIFVVTADPRSARGVADLVRQRVVLGLADRNQYGEFGVDQRRVPQHVPPGRGVLPTTGDAVQIAQPPPSRKVWSAPSSVVAPFRVVALPRVWELDGSVGAPDHAAQDNVGPDNTDLDNTDPDRTVLPLGLGGDQAELRWVDLAEVPTIPVAGPPGSGRTAALAAWARWFTEQGREVVTISAEDRPLVRGVTHLVHGAEPPLLRPRTVVFADDVDNAHAHTLVSLWQREGEQLPVVLSADLDALRVASSGLLGALQRRRHGVVLQPAGTLRIFGWSRSGPARPLPPGRGVWISNRTVMPIQLPS
jgi:S-DNA-T family DNA segregation ATPase FtsK/SpoIIIE